MTNLGNVRDTDGRAGPGVGRPEGSGSGTPGDPVVLPIRAPRRPGRWIASVLVLAVLAFCVNSVARNERFRWDVVGEYFAADMVFRGLLVTLELTGVIMALAIPLSILVASMRLSQVPVVRSVAWGFVWFFRSVPGLVQLLIWFNLAALYPKLNFGIPFGPTFVSLDANEVITPMMAAIIGFTLHEVAYLAEIFRAALVGVDRGQREAAQSLGFPPWTSFRRVVLPQAVRFVIPPTVNQTIGLLKGTSLVSVIGLTDLLYSVQKVYSVTLETIPLLLVATIWYLIMTSALSVVQFYLERYYDRGHVGGKRPNMLLRYLRGRAKSRTPEVGA